MMTDWKSDIEATLKDFTEVALLAGDDLAADQVQVEFLEAPHRLGTLPRGKMAIYSFWADGEWLKIGKVGPNSNARFNSQHYNPNSAASTLAGSILKCSRINSSNDIPAAEVGAWIKANAHRCNIYLDASQPKSLLSLLEAFLHHRLKPRYEG